MRALLFALALGACAPTAPPVEAEPGAPPASADTCGMARFQHLIGRPASEIDRATLPPGTRIITPDSMVTQDYAPARLNIFTGTDGRVSSMRCF